MRPPAPAVSALRARYEQRVERLTALRHVRSELVSLAGLIGKPVINQAGQQIGRVADVVARWDSDQPYPPVTGLIVRVGRRRAWLPIDAVEEFRRDRVRLRTARLDLREVARRPGEVELARDVIDHQLVDTDGARVIRASDLYLARVAGVVQLVGVDVGFNSLLRRLGPAGSGPGRPRRRSSTGPASPASARSTGRAAPCRRRGTACSGCGRVSWLTCWRT